MNYTITRSKVIFELPLSGYLGDSYNHKTKEYSKIQSLQEKEEDLFMIDLNFYPYIEIEDEHREEAKKWLLSQGYTEEEVNLFGDELDGDIRRALCSAKESSYHDEWLTEYRRRTQNHIEDDIAGALSGVQYKIIDDLTDKDYFKTRAAADNIRIEIDKKEVKKWLKENNYEEEDEGYFADYALDISRKEIDTDYIDSYDSMGDYTGWLDCLKDYNDIEQTIKDYRQDEADKIDNAERASLEVKKDLENIDRYAAKYFTKEETRQKIARQVSALKSVIKNAV